MLRAACAVDESAENLALLRQMSAIATHDLRNLLTMIGGHAGLMQLHGPTEEVQQSIDAIRRAVTDAGAILADLQDALRVAGPPAPYQPVHLLTMVNQTVGYICGMIHSLHNITLLRDVPAELHIIGNPHEIRRALLNLLKNAIEAMPGGGVLSIHASIARPPRGLGLDVNEPMVRITVNDTGEGIAPDVMADLFHRPRTTKPHGTGLGLVSCHTIINAHGGALEIQSEPGSGTRAVVWLPTAEACIDPFRKFEYSGGDSGLLSEEEAMLGLMMDYPLTLTHILDRADKLYGRKPIISRTATGIHRYTYAEMTGRTRRLANAFERLGIPESGRVATFAWNSFRHLELYFAAPCSGRVLHTLNIRLFPDQVAFIANHAEDQVVFVDASLLPVFEKIAPHCSSIRHIVVMADGPLPETSLPNVLDYETLLAESSPEYTWPTLDENRACAMCYTSGTTGHPKGVVYSHRSMFLHSLGVCLADSVGICERDVVMPVVPMFHANAWGLPYAAHMVGATQVFPGPFLAPPDLAQLIQDEQITVAAGVPTIWLGLLQMLGQRQFDLSSLRAMPVGGSAAPQSMIERYQREHNLYIVHAWGMTETSPIGTLSNLKSYMQALPEAERFKVRAKQGIPLPLVEIRIVGDDGRELPWDGKVFGELQIRGPWITAGYYNDPRSSASFDDGWFRTGDVAAIDPEGYVQIVDRTKDLVKSGGEWISTVDLENAIMGHPKVLEAAVIAAAHPKWQERPLACVVPRPEYRETLTAEEILTFLGDKVAKWQMPDAVVFIESVPKTSVGKFDKKVLREQYKDFQFAE